MTERSFRGMFLDSRRVLIHPAEEKDEERLLASPEQCLADDIFSRKVEAEACSCWTRRPAVLAESLYKFGQAADLAHYEKAIESVCSKSAQHDHSQAMPITKPMAIPRANLCKSKLLSTDLPCGFTRNWSCPSFPPAVKATANGIAASDGSLGYHCCCEIERLRTGLRIAEKLYRTWELLAASVRSVTWSRHPFEDDADSMPEPQKVRIKVVTYNIFWWNLFGIHKGNGGTAGGVVATSNVREPIDLIAFQECRDKDRVLDDAGLLNSFHTFAGMYEKCIALNKEAWIWLEEGEEDVWNCKVFGQAGSPTTNPVFFPKGPPPPPGVDLHALLRAPPGSSDEEGVPADAADGVRSSLEAEEELESEHPCEDDECVEDFSTTDHTAAGAAGPTTVPTEDTGHEAATGESESSSDGFSPPSPDSDGDFGHETGTKD
eukprot:s2509_g15.t1